MESANTAKNNNVEQKSKINLLLAGVTGAGKSSLGNLLSGAETFKVSDKAVSETKDHSVATGNLKGIEVTVIDTMGLNDTNDSQTIVRSKITKAIKSMKGGFDVLLFVVKLDRYTAAEHIAFEYLCHAILGEECFDNAYVVFTHCHAKYVRPPKSEEEQKNWLAESRKKNHNLNSLLNSVNNKFIFVCNPPVDADDTEQEDKNKKLRDLTVEGIAKVLAQHNAPRYFFKAAITAQKEYDEKLRKLEEERAKASEEQKSVFTSQIKQLKAAFKNQLGQIIEQRENEARKNGFFTTLGSQLDTAAKRVWGWLIGA